MNFDLTDEQQMLQAAARDFLAARLKSEKIRALAEPPTTPSTRTSGSEMADLNWPGLMVSEDYGGQELGTVELAVLMEQLGYALAPGPDPLEHARRARARDGRAPTSSASATWRRSRPASSAARSRSGTAAPGWTPDDITLEPESLERRLHAERREAVRARRRDAPTS